MSESENHEVDFVVAASHLFAAGRKWAMQRDRVEAMRDLIGATFNVDSSTLARALRPAAGNSQPTNGVAVVPLRGVITPRGSFLSLLFGEEDAGLAGFRNQLRSAVANPDVNAIVMDIDSPGGLVDHVPETAQAIRDARNQKPIVAVANPLAASAAYWLASQAHEISITPSGEAGSVGVYQLHRDLSEAHQQAGIKPTLIAAGKYKTEGNPYMALDPSAREAMQSAVDDYYGMFTADVAAGRGMPAPPEDVADGVAFGGGRVLTAKRAVSAGLADRVATLDQTVKRLASGRARVKQTEGPSGSSGLSSLVWDEEDVDVTASEPTVFSDEEKDRLLTLVGLR